MLPKERLFLLGDFSVFLAEFVRAAPISLVTSRFVSTLFQVILPNGHFSLCNSKYSFGTSSQPQVHTATTRSNRSI